MLPQQAQQQTEEERRVTEEELHGRLAELKRTLHALLPEPSPATPAAGRDADAGQSGDYASRVGGLEQGTQIDGALSCTS